MTCPTPETVKATMRMRRICVIVPTYNNAGTLRHVLESVAEYCADIIVVNDGSTDSTADILGGMGGAVDVVSYAANRGKGHALREGFRRAAALGFDYAITIDSDDQHKASDIPGFVEAIACHPGALIVGKRNLDNVDINARSSFANKFSNFWFSVQTGRRVPDTQSGYRAYPLKRLHGLSLLTSRYEAELELLVTAAWHGTEIVSIPIDVYYPPQSERVSHFRPALDFTRISILNTVLCVGALAYGVPARTWNYFRRRKPFGREFRPFTRHKGAKRPAARTLGRRARSIYGIANFFFWTACAFAPFARIYFAAGKVTENKRLRFHKMLRWVAEFLESHFPAGPVSYRDCDSRYLDKPALIVCNHQSHLDVPVLMALHPKMVFLTNDRVWNNPFYGDIIRHAEYLPVSTGIDDMLPHLRSLRDRGYSIVVFPEGTRSADCRIMRFHQGAFYMARELELDVQPMVLHGAGHYLPKNDFMFRKNPITLKMLPRVTRSELKGLELRRQASSMRRLIRAGYDRIASEREKTDYFKSLALYKYAYRGWDTVARCKRTLRQSSIYAHIIDNGKGKRIRILDSGIGVFALLYALVNKEAEVYAYESCLRDHMTAVATPELPPNLHFIHAVWTSDFGNDDDFDTTIALAEDCTGVSTNNIIKINIES